MSHRLRWSWLGVVALTVAPSLGRAQAPAPQTHTVRKGDTLWDLARTYRSDPFLWPDIYRLNTAVVEDPHWIYPGEVLRLGPGEGVASVPTVDTPPPSDSVPLDSGAVVVASAARGAGDVLRSGGDGSASDTAQRSLFGEPRRRTMKEVLRAYTDQPYRPLRRSEFYSSGFLSENDKLPFGAFLGPVTPKQIRSTSSGSHAGPFSTVAVSSPSRATYRVGDTLLVAQVGPRFEDYGNAIVPTGLLEVSGEAGGRYLASVIAIYGPLRSGQRVLPAETFTDAGRRRAVPVPEGVRGTLLGGPAPQELKEPQMVVYLDRGRQDGVAPGDIFEARRTPRRLPDGTLRVDELMATLQVVHVRAHTATARILNVVSPDLPPGTTVRQIAKLPS